jgi:hypothetical protein
MIVQRGILGVATQAASDLLIAEIYGESARRGLAAYLLDAVAPSVLDRTPSSGDIGATQLARTLPGNLCAGSPARLRSVEGTRSGYRAGRLSPRPGCGLPRT